MYPDFVRLCIFNKKIGNFFERKLRIYKNFNLKIQMYFFLLGPTFFLINVAVRRLYQSDVCNGPMFVLVWRLYWSDVCTVRRLSQSDIWTGPMFVLVRSLYCPTFLSLCTVRCLWVRHLYWYLKLRLYCPTFVSLRFDYCLRFVGPTFVLVP